MSPRKKFKECFLTEEDRKCLFCTKNILPTNINKVDINGGEIIIKTEPESEGNKEGLITFSSGCVSELAVTSTLGRQLQSMYVVRKLLNISQESCTEYLKYGSPNEWFKLCSTCQSIVSNCYKLERDLARIQRQLEKQKGIVKELIHNSTVEEEVGKGKKRRGRPLQQPGGDGGGVSSQIRWQICQSHPKSVTVAEAEVQLNRQTRYSARGSQSRSLKTGSYSYNEDGLEVDNQIEKINDFDLCGIDDVENGGKNSRLYQSPEPLPENVEVDHEEGATDFNASIAVNEYSPPPSPLEDVDDDKDWTPPASTPSNSRKRQRAARKPTKAKVITSTLKVVPERDPLEPDSDPDSHGIAKKKVKQRRRVSCTLKLAQLFQKYNSVSQNANGEVILNEIPFYCDYCPVIFPKEARLLMHAYRSHLTEPLQPCGVGGCQLEYFSKQQLDIHRKHEHPNEVKVEEAPTKPEPVEPVECPHCPSIFPSILSRDYHIAQGHYEKFLQCEICGYKSASLTRTLRHSRSHIISEKRDAIRNKYLEYRKLVEERTRNRKRPEVKKKTPKGRQSLTTLYFKESRTFSRVIRKDTGLPFYCDHCHMIYPYESRLFQHCKNYHASKPLSKCDTCGAEVHSKQLLRLHQESKHPEIYPRQEEPPNELCQCPHCPKEFYSVLRRDYHISIAHFDILTTCKICGYQAKNKKEYYLHRHMLKHSTSNQFLCDLCSRSFKTEQMLVYHHRGVHYEELGLKPFKCRFCGCTFGSKQDLQQHEQFSHEKIKEHCCEFCGKKFARKADLKKHILLHTAPREKQYKQGPFFCQFCNDKFNVRQGLYYHLKKLHSDKFFYRCDDCGKGYCFAATLYQHKRNCKGGGGGEKKSLKNEDS